MKKIPIKFWGVKYDVSNGCDVILSTPHGHITVRVARPMDFINMLYFVGNEPWELCVWENDADMAVHLPGTPIGEELGFFCIIFDGNPLINLRKCLEDNA